MSKKLKSRQNRSLIAALLLTVVLLNLTACGATSPTTAPAATVAATTAPANTAATSTTAVTGTTAATTGTTAATSTTAATTTGTSAAAASGTTASTTADTSPKVVAAANAFLATLDATQKSTVLFDWSNTAQKQRWSNFPNGAFQRAGLMWGNLSDAQKQAWLAVMSTTLSKEGYQRVLNEWNADDALAATDSGGGTANFGTKYYYIALIGTPSMTTPWQWQFGGHHVTINATVAKSNIVLTPSFIGCQPCSYKDASGNTIRPLGDIDDTAIAFLNSLDATQKTKAVLGTTTIDLVLGPGQDGKKIASEGLAGSAMTADQQAALLKLMGYYGNLLNEEDAAARMADLKTNLPNTYFAWYGSTTDPTTGYFRITGPTVVIEHSPQGAGRGGSGAASADHVHGMYRDPTNDYGATIAKQ